MWIEDNSVTIDMYRDPDSGKIRHNYTIRRNDGSLVIKHIIEVVDAIIETHNDGCVKKSSPQQDGPFTILQT